MDIIRIDSTVLHSEILPPVLRLLGKDAFANPDREYREAHHAYRNGEYSDCLVDCAKALESVLKINGSRRGWKITASGPAGKLIQAAKAAGFLEVYHENHDGNADAVVSTLDSLLDLGDGLAYEPITVRDHVAAKLAGSRQGRKNFAAVREAARVLASAGRQA